MDISLITWDERTSCAIKCLYEFLQSDHQVASVIAEDHPPESRAPSQDSDEWKYWEYYQRFKEERSETDAFLEQYPTLQELQDVKEYHLHIVQDRNSERTVNKLAESNADLMVVEGAGLLKKEVFSTAKHGAINFHTGILPYRRGNSTLYWALRSMEKDMVGYTIHFIDEGVDTGDIIYRERVPIYEGDTRDSIFRRCEERGAKTMVSIADTIERLEGDIPTIAQDTSVGVEYRGNPTPKEWYELAKVMESEEWRETMVDGERP